jgi:hypothetical protein
MVVEVCPASFPPTAPVPLDARQSPSPDPLLRGRRPLALRMRRSSSRRSSSMSSISPLPATHVRTRRHVGTSARIRNMAQSHSSPPMTNRCSSPPRIRRDLIVHVHEGRLGRAFHLVGQRAAPLLQPLRPRQNHDENSH